MKNLRGQITKNIANIFIVKGDDNKDYKCSARGKLKRGEELFVGDYVDITEVKENTAVIESVLARKNCLIRPYVANIDATLIIVAKEPEPDMVLLDKVLLNCFSEGIEPILCYNKADMTSAEQIEELFRGYPHVEKIAISAKTGQGFEKLISIIKGKLVCFAGQSAVGKSSVLNKLYDDEVAKVGQLSQKIKRGKNTTRHIEIFEIAGAKIVDTCGFSMLEAIKINEKDLIYYYDDFLNYQNQCKFRGCQHITEPECAVRVAVDKGEIDKGRYTRYCLIFNELKKYWRNKYE